QKREKPNSITTYQPSETPRTPQAQQSHERIQQMTRRVDIIGKEHVDGRRQPVKHATIDIEIENLGVTLILKQRRIVIDNRKPILALQFLVPGNAVMRERQKHKNAERDEKNMRGRTEMFVPDLQHSITSPS